MKIAELTKFTKLRARSWIWQFWQIIVNFITAKSTWQNWQFWRNFSQICHSEISLVDVTNWQIFAIFVTVYINVDISQETWRQTIKGTERQKQDMRETWLTSDWLATDKKPMALSGQGFMCVRTQRGLTN